MATSLSDEARERRPRGSTPVQPPPPPERGRTRLAQGAEPLFPPKQSWADWLKGGGTQDIDTSMADYRRRMTGGQQPTMRFDPSGAQTPLREQIPISQRAQALAQWAGMGLPGRGGMIYGKEPMRKAAQAEKASGINPNDPSHWLANRQRADELYVDPMVPSGEYAPVTKVFQREGRRRSQAEGTAQPFDFTSAEPIFETSKVRLPYSGNVTPPHYTVDQTRVSYDVPGRGKVRVGDVYHGIEGTPGDRWMEMYDVRREPNISLNPAELTYIKRKLADVWDQQHGGIYPVDPTQGARDTPMMRLFNWEGPWRR